MQSMPITAEVVSLLDTILCDKVCQWLATGRWFSPVSSSSNTDRHEITEILFKVALSTTTQALKYDSILPTMKYYKKKKKPTKLTCFQLYQVTFNEIMVMTASFK